MGVLIFQLTARILHGRRRDNAPFALQQARLRTGNGRHGARFKIVVVAEFLDQHQVARTAPHADGNLSGHGGRGQENTGFDGKIFGHCRFEPIHRRVFAVARITNVRRINGLPHSGVRQGKGIGA